MRNLRTIVIKARYENIELCNVDKNIEMFSEKTINTLISKMKFEKCIVLFEDNMVIYYSKINNSANILVMTESEYRAKYCW